MVLIFRDMMIHPTRYGTRLSTNPSLVIHDHAVEIDQSAKVLGTSRAPDVTQRDASGRERGHYAVVRIPGRLGCTLGKIGDRDQRPLDAPVRLLIIHSIEALISSKAKKKKKASAILYCTAFHDSSA